MRTGDGERLNDIVWLHPDGRPMDDGDWTAEGATVIGMYLNGHGIAGLDATGNQILDDHFLLYFNAGADDLTVTLPSEEFAEAWDAVVDTAAAKVTHDPLPAREKFELPGRSLVVLKEYLEPEEEPDLSVAASLVAMAEPPAEKPARSKK